MLTQVGSTKGGCVPVPALLGTVGRQDLINGDPIAGGSAAVHKHNTHKPARFT